jgi:hypothetical protein
MSFDFGRVSEGPSGFIPPISAFSSNKYVQGSRDFLESNSLVAKFAFLILVLIAFVVLLRIGTSLLSLIFSPKRSPVLIDGMIDAKQLIRVPQDPKVSSSIPILRSVNANEGIEFTWSVWIYVDDFTYKQHEYKHIFHKGNDNINVSNPPLGLNFPNNGPGLYITPNTNDLLIIMNTFDNINEEIVIKDLPLNKWVSVIIRVTKQNQLDVYINGVLTKRHMLKGVPKQNYGDVFASMNGGFSGYTSGLRYFDSALGTNKIQSIVDDGPNMKMIGGTDIQKSKPQYLSTRWYFTGSNDSYNP